MNGRQRATGIRCWPVTEWPQADRIAWALSQEAGDPFRPGGAAARWSEATRVMAANGYGRWLAWLYAEGLLNLNDPPDARVNSESVFAYIGALAQVNAPLTVQARVRQLGYAMRAIAPHGDWGWIQRGADRLRAVAVPFRDKRRRLVSPDQLIELGQAIMDAAEADEGLTAIRRAADYRDGLLIAFLAYRPLREKDLAKLTLGTHVLRQGDEWWIDLVTSKTKTRLQMLFPKSLVVRLNEYLTVHRPVLLDVGERHGRPSTEALWVSSIGTQTSTAILAYQITRRTRKAFGRSVNPNLFRDCAATWIAVMDPEQANIIRMILGHTTMAMSERHYNHAASLHAVRRYQGTVAALRRSAKSIRPDDSPEIGADHVELVEEEP